MKKKIFGGLLVLAIAAVAAFNVNMNSEDSEFSLLSLANLEALAENESGNEVYEDYKNVTDRATHRETEISIDKDGVKIERKVDCVVYTTSCKSSKGKKCYQSLNGMVKSCN